MDIAEVLKLADELLFTHTGEHLNNLQTTILKGTLQSQKYATIASENSLSEGHIRDIGSELWQSLSDILGEDINKLNVRNILEKSIIAKSVSSESIINTDNQVSIYSKNNKQFKSSHLSKSTADKPYLDIYTAPEITAFYGRTDELSTLKTWLIQNCSRVITLAGITGIGKTTLAVKLIKEISTQFEYIVYRSLRYCPTLDNFLTDLLPSLDCPTIPNTLDRQVDILLKFLRKHRCLIIIDDLQMLFQPGQFAGQYKPEVEGYALLFKQIVELSHASSLLLITSEQLEDLITNRHKFTRCLKLTGLGESATEILRHKELSNEQMWDTLIEKYQGHPLWLEMTATVIEELFAGKVAEFLAYPDLILSNAIEFQLSHLWIRLTEPEKQVVNYLATQKDAVTLSQLLQEKFHSPIELLKAIQSLKRRCLLEYTSNCVGTSYEKHRYSSLLRINQIFKAHLISRAELSNGNNSC